jgi:glyoxalase/bleomycin resistance protein/dioxygenase superfamily protein
VNGNKLVSKILQIFIVVDDAERYANTYSEKYGIGPWVFQDFSDSAVPHKFINGRPQPYQMKLAICDALNVNLALIEPLDDLSIFATHLKNKGPGLHHLLVGSEMSYEQALKSLADGGNRIVQGGLTATGLAYSHVDTSKDLGTIIELFGLPEHTGA